MKKNKDVIFCTAGSAGEGFSTCPIPKKGYSYYSHSAGFGKLKVCKENLKVSLIDLNGEVCVTETIENKHIPKQKQQNE